MKATDTTRRRCGQWYGVWKHIGRVDWALALFGVVVMTSACAPTVTRDANVGATAATADAVVMNAAAPVARPSIRRATPLSHLSFGRRGAGWGPGMPGWSRIASVMPAGRWSLGETTDERIASWLRGPGGTLKLPVGDEGVNLRWLSLWLYPVTSKQAVSVFLNERLLKTVHLKAGWGRYDLPLPAGGLTPGEHRVRLWFRHVRYRGHLKTPGAIGGIALAPDLTTSEFIESKAVLASAAEPSRLVAGPPARWYTHVVPTTSSRLSGRMVVGKGPGTAFVIQIAEDGRKTREIGRFDVSTGASKTFDLSLREWAGRLIRLQFKTAGVIAPITDAHWFDLSMSHDVAQVESPRPVRNLIVWAIEGMWSNGPRLGRQGGYAEMPNLGLMQAQGVTALHVWTGRHAAHEAQRLFLDGSVPQGGLVRALSNAGIATGFFTARGKQGRVATGFDTNQNVELTADEPGQHALLSALGNWLRVRRSERFFAFVDVALHQPSRKATPANSAYLAELPDGLMEPQHASEAHRMTWRRVMQTYHAHLNVNDLWLGELMALLHGMGRSEDTAILVLGLPSRGLNPFRMNALDPARLSVPAVLWRTGGWPRGRTLSDPVDFERLTPTVLSMLTGHPLDSDGPADLWPYFLGRGEPVSKPYRGKTPFGPVVQYGDWVWWPTRSAANRLWQHTEWGHRSVAHEKYPIVVRALTDRLTDRRAADEILQRRLDRTVDDL
ncbi:MAG: hypothetical protein VX589_17185 [Myxococcota bacterium]|nr:hypothetical protein [Myxococcota bacterium]